MKEIYIAGAVRTAIGTLGGGLKEMPAALIGAAVIKEACMRAKIDVCDVDQVIMGNVLQAGQGQNPARQAAMAAGIPKEVPAVTINKVCGSGLYAVNIASALIASGQAECIIVGGMENMSRAPHLVPLRWGQKMGNVAMVDSMVHEGLWDIFNDYHMGITAENVAEKFEITRKQQDEFALRSQKKAAAAVEKKRFEEEIIPVVIPQKRGEEKIFCEDEHIRFDASAEGLARLKPAFKKDGTVTAGNASGINDGGACMVMMSKDFAQVKGIKPQVRWVSGASCGVDPAIMGIGPVNSVKKALKTAGLILEDIDLIEANEAFASQAIAVLKLLDIQEEKVNVNGGALALGHPIGASGARITVTLIYEMMRRKSHLGLSTLCIGGGMGEAAIFERDSFCM